MVCPIAISPAIFDNGEANWGGAVGPGHVFLSYSTSDRPLAEDLSRRLETRGVRVWIAPRDITPGSDYSEAIEDALESSSAVVALISDGANASRHVKAEIEIAFSRGKPLFPVRFQDIQPAKGLSLFLNLGHWTDLFGAGETASLDRLAAELVGRSGAIGAAPVPIRPPANPRPRQPAVSMRFLVVTIALSLVVLASVVAFAILRRPVSAAPQEDAAATGAGAGAAKPGQSATPPPDVPKAPTPVAIAPLPPTRGEPLAAGSDGGSLWEHNGSLLRLRAEGRRRVFVYLQTRPGVPARPGDVLFDGERSGLAYRGTAYLFSSQCGRIGYAVAGSVTPGDRHVALRGDAPVRDRRSCAITGSATDQLVFRYVRAR